jgi:hypothetical protein
VDATGLESRHTSRYFFRRAGRRHSGRLWTKLTVACDTNSHLFLGATVRLRTDAAGAQGEVSFLDLPYDFTQVGGMSVAQLSLGGQILSNDQPLISAAPASELPSASSAHLPAFTASFNALTNTATFTAAHDLGTPQTLQITVDPNTGLLMNNRFAAGDTGFADAYDFGGGQHVQATAGATIIIVDSYGYSVVLGSNAPGSAATDLLAHFDVTSNDNRGTLTINDGAGSNPVVYTVSQDANGLEFTTDDGSLHVTDEGPNNVFGGGVSLITGLESAGVHVLASQSGESLTLDSLNPQEVAYVGDGDLQNVKGNVSVTNSAPGGTTSLYVDNGLGVNAVPEAVTISGTSITGLAPAAIFYSNKRTDDVVIVGGSTSSTYLVTGSLGGSVLGLTTGSGLDTVIVGNNGVVDDTFFPGNLIIQESNAQDRIDIDNSNGTPANVALTNSQVNGLDIAVVNGFTFKPIQVTGFATLGLGLGGSGNTFSVNSTAAGPGNIDVTSAGDLTVAQSSLLGNNLDVSTTAGNVTVAGPIATGGGTLSVHTPAANSIQVNQTINTAPGSGGRVQTGSNVSPQQPNALYVAGAGNTLLNAPGSITANAGSPQSTLVRTAFATTLQALVLDSHGNPVGSGVAVTFTAPGSGASGTFANHATTEIDVTNASGVATSSTFTANDTAGSYTVTASTAGAGDPAAFSLTNTSPVVVGQLGNLVVTASSSTPVLNHTVTFSVSVTNIGAVAVPAGSATVTVTLPAGLTAAAGSPLTFTVGALAAGQTATFLTAATAAALGPQTVTAKVTGSVVGSPVSNSTTITVLTPQQHFVEALYLDELGRPGRLDELNYWAAMLGSGSSLATVADGILHSFEARDRLVKGWYQKYLGRPAVNNEELFFVNQLLAGQTEEQALSELFASSEFLNHAQTLSNAVSPQQGFVQALYQLLLNRTPAAADLVFWENVLAGQGQGGVALGFLTSTEFRADAVTGYYNTLLHRPPDAPGLSFWVTSALDLASIRTQFESTLEYFTNG